MENENPIRTTVEELRKLLEIQNFVGEPVETEDKLLIPVMKMGMGFGVGTGEGNGPGNESGGKGTGAGAAAGVQPIAMVVVTKGVTGPEGIRVLNLTGNNLSKTIAELGTVITDIMKESRPFMNKNSKDKSRTKVKVEKEPVDQ
jgi:uncharacterized spore protein YtfJ